MPKNDSLPLTGGRAVPVRLPSVDPHERPQAAGTAPLVPDQAVLPGKGAHDSAALADTGAPGGQIAKPHGEAGEGGRGVEVELKLLVDAAHLRAFRDAPVIAA